MSRALEATGSNNIAKHTSYFRVTSNGVESFRRQRRRQRTHPRVLSRKTVRRYSNVVPDENLLNLLVGAALSSAASS